MKLTDAIQHLKESLADPTHKWGCEECKQEHEQLLAWLEEYHKIKEYWLPSGEEELRKERGECNNLYEKIDIVVSGLCSKIADQIIEKSVLENKYKRLEADCTYLDNKLRTAEEAVKAWNTRASGWISCSVKLPEVGEPVLIYDPYNEEMVVASLDCDKTGFSNDDFYYGLKNVPLWMALPEKPKK